MIDTDRNKLRYNIINLIIYAVGIILVLRLFNFQIMHGEEYRKLSNNRLTREIVVTPTRGNILDRTGNILVGNTMGFELQLYKSKIDNETLNKTILNAINILEKNGDTYTDTFPIKINPFEYTYKDETLTNWKKNNKLDEDITAEEALFSFASKYEITNENIEEIRKIIAIRYRIQTEGYSSTKPLIIARNISRQSFIELYEQSNDFPGIDVVTKSLRDYKQGSLASHIIGYMGRINEEEYKERSENYGMNDYIGKLGIESIFEDYLRGKSGKRQVDMDINGTKVAEYDTEEAIQGSDVVLTIDASLQKVAEKALADNLVKLQNGNLGEVCNATRGAIIVTNVKNGEILAMVSLPDYEPQLFLNGISDEKWAEYRESNALYNVAAQGSYAPGSIFKMVTAIAGLESGVITTTEKINDTGVYPHGHNPVCWIWTLYHGGHGLLNVSEAIEKSCNYFFYEIGYRMGIEELEKYATYFGLGKKTGVEVLYETSGTLAGKTYYEKKGETWYLGNTLSAVIGQAENSFSPLQIAKYISMLANGGKNIDLTLIKTIINQDGTQVSREEIDKYVDEKIGRVNEDKENLNISEENINAILKGMKSVTSDREGTAYSAFRNLGIEVGGKTGSAEAGNKKNGWFVGFAPFDEPEISIVVFVEGGEHGSYAAEIARDIIAEYFGMDSETVIEDNTIKTYTQTIN